MKKKTGIRMDDCPNYKTKAKTMGCLTQYNPRKAF